MSGVLVFIGGGGGSGKKMGGKKYRRDSEDFAGEEVVDGVLDGEEFFGVFVGDADAELGFGGHDDFEVIEGVGSEMRDGG